MQRSDRWLILLLLAIVIAGAAVRVLPMNSGLPYPAYVDEHFVLRPAARMIADRTWDPKSYNYPPLTMYLAVIVAAVLQLLPAGPSIGAGARATIDQPIWASILSTDLIRAGRLVVLAFAVLTIVLAGLLALDLRGRRAAVLAAFLAAALPALVTRSAIVIVDTPTTFFASASVLCASYTRGARARQRFVWPALGGAAAGCATASKYNAGVVIVVLLTVIAFASDRSVRERVAMAAAASGCAVAAAFVGSPTLLFRTRALVDEYDLQNRLYSSKVTTSYWAGFLNHHEVGWPMLLVGAVGVLVLLREPRTRAFAAGAILFAVGLLTPLLRWSFQPFRNMLPLLPLLCVAAAVAIVATVDAAAARFRLRDGARTSAIALVAVGICAFMIVSAQHYYVDTFIDVDQSRVAARRWLEEHTTSKDNVLVASELAFTPNELAQVPADVTRASLTDPGVTRDDADKFDYVVVGDFPSAAKWRDALRDRAMRTRFGSAPTPTDARGAGNGRNLTVRVFGSPGTRDVSECYPFCG